MVRAPGAALAARLSCGARSLGIKRSWWRREWRERELITLVTGYNVSMFAALSLCRGGRLSVRGAVSVGLCSRTIVLLRQPNNNKNNKVDTRVDAAQWLLAPDASGWLLGGTPPLAEELLRSRDAEQVGILTMMILIRTRD